MKLEKLLNELGFSTVLEYQVGNYFLDVYVDEIRTGFEYDGPFHWKKKDKKRDDIINKYGIKVIRFTDKTLNKENVLHSILNGE